MLLKNFRSEFKELLLAFLWKQWSKLGVAGQTINDDPTILDIEALLLFTATLGRHDARLFDEVLDWLQVNGWLINVMRLKRIMREEKFNGERVIAAIAGSLANGTETAKWKLLSTLPQPPGKSENLLYDTNEIPLPVLGEAEPGFSSYGYLRGPIRLRGLSQPFPSTAPASLVLQLRALFGVSVRCEIIAYLLSHDEAHPSEIAKAAYYFPRTVQSTLVDMARSGTVGIRTSNREKNYWIKKADWHSLLKRSETSEPKWVTWPPLLSALEQIWLRLEDPKWSGLDPLLQSSELRELMRIVKPALARAGADRELSDDRQFLGQSYLPIFISDLKKILQKWTR